MVTFYHDIEQDIDCKANPKECRRMVKEFLKLEKKYDIPVTYNIVGTLFQEQPDLIEWILQEGQEVAFHSYNHQSDWQPKHYSDEIDLWRKVSSLPCGYRSPRSQWNRITLKTLWEKGFLWNAESDTHKEPYFIYKGLVRLPIATDDYLLYNGTLTVDQWVQQFSGLLKSRTYFGFGSHDSLTSFAPEERLKAWERILQIAIENKVFLFTFSEAADLFRRAALSRYSSITAKNWDQDTETLYRTKRFQEIIRAEAEKLDQPIIADLGSGGSVLSLTLKDIAKKIYCVDNAPGTVADVDSDSNIQAWFGEVTDSNLPDNSIDLVICGCIIEYLFWPNRLADEIKRIGKIGSTYFITFPDFRGISVSNEGCPSNKIRHYFTPDEIQKWADQIGPGRLIGIQYEVPESDNPETEQRYRIIEKNSSPDAYPTNWAYIGTIQNKFTPKRCYRRTIPLPVVNFRFPNQRYNHFKMYLVHIGRRFPKPIRKLGKWLLYHENTG